MGFFIQQILARFFFTWIERKATQSKKEPNNFLENEKKKKYKREKLNHWIIAKQSVNISPAGWNVWKIYINNKVFLYMLSYTTKTTLYFNEGLKCCSALVTFQKDTIHIELHYCLKAFPIWIIILVIMHAVWVKRHLICDRIFFCQLYEFIVSAMQKETNPASKQN